MQFHPTFNKSKLSNKESLLPQVRSIRLTGHLQIERLLNKQDTFDNRSVVQNIKQV